MVFTPDVAKLIAMQFSAEPVLSTKGSRKGQHIKYAYRFSYNGPCFRHISIARKATKDGVTVYINKLSVTQVGFPNDKLEKGQVRKEYPKGSMGKTGDKGVSSAAGGLETLNPRNHDVLRLSVSSEDAFRSLLTWYFGLDGEKQQGLCPDGALPVSRAAAVNIDLEIHADHSLTAMGYESDPEIRKKIEQHAVAKARDFYEKGGYRVVEKGKPYDLLCKKSEEIIHVEVKGSRNSLEAIIVTTNEIGDARNTDWRSDLFLVESIDLKPDGKGNYLVSGGRCRRAENWVPHDKDLDPICYRYSLPHIPDEPF